VSVTQDTIASEDAFESVGLADVDAEKGIAVGVKLLGLRSRNNRNYDTPGVRKTAIRHLSGSRVYINHPAKATDNRDYHDKFGVVSENVEYREGKGYFGTIYFNPQHAAASQFVWDITHAPKTMGMSVNASIESEKPVKGKDSDVNAIESIRSVDVVTNPATTDGIFEEHIEEEEEMALTLEEIKKHPELIKSILEEHNSEATEQAELIAAKKSAKDLQDRLDAIESERAAEKLTASLTTEFAKIFESVEIAPDLMKEVVECACEMAEPQRKKFAGVMSKMSPMFIQVPDDEEEEETSAAPAKEEVEEKTYSPGRKKPKAGSKLNLLSAMGLK